MEQSAAQILRERIWVNASGFELDPSALPSIEESLCHEITD
jgi:hypothetical protein